jgi:hypothetical protein
VHQTAVVVVDGGGFGSPSHQRAAKWLFARPSLTYYHPLSKATAHKKSQFYCTPPPTWPRRLILSAGPLSKVSDAPMVVLLSFLCVDGRSLSKSSAPSEKDVISGEGSIHPISHSSHCANSLSTFHS